MKREELKQRISEKLDASKMAELEADLAGLSDEDLDQVAGGIFFAADGKDLRASGPDASAQRRNIFFAKYKDYFHW